MRARGRSGSTARPKAIFTKKRSAPETGTSAMHDADTTREVRRLCGEELVGCRLSDEIVEGGTVPGAGLRLARRPRQRDPSPAARDIDEAMNSERIAFANEQREAAIA